MNTKDAYRQNIQAELELIKANLIALKANAHSATTDVQLSYYKEIDTIEKNYSIIQSKLGELGEVGEGSWEHLKKDIDSSWDLLREYAKKTPDENIEIKKDIK